MPVFNSEQLLQELSHVVQEGVIQVNALKALESSALQQAPAVGSWTAVQHLHHLNFYASFYTEAIEACLDQAKSTAKKDFHSGWLGNYFTEIIGPAKEGKTVKKTMKSPANAQPPVSDDLDVDVELEAYLGFQNRLLYLLRRAGHVDIGAHRVPTSLSQFLRLKLGDSFRFVIAHQQRHMQHIERAGYFQEKVG